MALGGEAEQPYSAEIADDGARTRLWPKITADRDKYAGYQRKTDREIPVVLLEAMTP